MYIYICVYTYNMHTYVYNIYEYTYIYMCIYIYVVSQKEIKEKTASHLKTEWDPSFRDSLAAKDLQRL